MSYLFADSSSRAHDSEGQRYATKCFERTFATRPQDHILICGHHIKTIGEKERCGSNCAPSDTADRKVKEPPFACPVPHCHQDRIRMTERNKVFLPKPGQTRIRFRTCRLGQDLMAAAKGGQGTSNERKYRTRDESHQPRKRSRSPIHTRQAQTGAQREEDSMDPAEAINALVASDAAYKAAFQFSGPGVRAKKDGRYKTRKDWELEFKDKAVARALDNLHVLSGTEFRQKLKEARRQQLASDPGFGRADKEFGEEIESTRLEDHIGAGIDTGLDCTVCGDRAEDIAFKCTLCVEFVFCNSCMMLKRSQHPKDKNHRFRVIQPTTGLDGVVDNEMDGEDEAAEVPHEPAHEPASFCKCETTSKQYLITCADDNCKTLFHPGCFGRGLFEDAMYEQENREYYLRKDYNAAKSRPFLCEACSDDVPVESEQSRQRSARFIGRAKDRADEAQSKATKVYNSQEEAAKQAELKLAKTQEERVAIEAKWEEIADEEGDVDQDGQDAGIQTYDLGQIAIRFKPQ